MSETPSNDTTRLAEMLPNTISCAEYTSAWLHKSQALVDALAHLNLSDEHAALLENAQRWLKNAEVNIDSTLDALDTLEQDTK